MKKSFEAPIRRFCSFLAPVRHLLPAFDRVKFVLWLQIMNVGSWRDTVITPSFPASFWDASLNPKLNLGWRFFFPPKYLLANVCEFAGKHEPLALLPRVVHPAHKNMSVWAEEQECWPDRRDLAACASRICCMGVCWWLPAQLGFFSHYCTWVGKVSLFGKGT